MGEHGIAVALLLDVQGRVEMREHSDQPGDLLRLIQTVGARAPDIDLLERDDVGRQGGDHPRNPLRRDPPVGAAAMADVVGEQAQAPRRRRCRLIRREFRSFLGMRLDLLLLHALSPGRIAARRLPKAGAARANRTPGRANRSLIASDRMQPIRADGRFPRPAEPHRR
ncbi:hypothetical protein M2440_002282 [Methylorubrum extorquens]|nr:hypothetical protein [Methylorubrum extorquens]